MKPVILLVLNVLLALPLRAQDYEIRLHRPRHVGQKEKISVLARISESSSIWLNGKEIRPEKKDTTVALEGITTDLAIHPKGKPNRVSVEIGKLERTENGVKTEVLPPGTAVIAYATNGSTAFQIKGNEVGSNIFRALSLVINVSVDDWTIDEVYGTSERKKVGDTWNANISALEKMLKSRPDPTMIMTNVAGRTTLKDVLKDPSGDRLLVEIETSANFLPTKERPGVTVAPPGMLMKMTVTGEFPTNSTRQTVAESVKWNMSGRMLMDSKLKGAEVRMNTIRTVSQRTSPIP